MNDSLLEHPSLETEAPEQSYLRILLSNQATAVMPVHVVKEVGVLDPNVITRLPGISPPLMGLINYRNRIYWLADLESVCCIDSEADPQRHATLIILAKEEHRLALAVSQVRGRVSLALVPADGASEPLPQPMVACHASQFPGQVIYAIDPDLVLHRCLDQSQSED